MSRQRFSCEPSRMATSHRAYTFDRAVRNLTMLHFAKREFESLFIHTFSRPTLPTTYVFRK